MNGLIYCLSRGYSILGEKRIGTVIDFLNGFAVSPKNDLLIAFDRKQYCVDVSEGKDFIMELLHFENGDRIIADVYDDWIGTRYCCFENNNIATWIYFTNDRFVFKCTPLYEGLFDDYVLAFKEFIKDSKEYQNDFSCHIYRKFMHNLKKMILP